MKHPNWLPTPDNIIKLVMRDKEAWGYNDKGELVSKVKQKLMDQLLAFHWDKIIHKVCGQQLWCATKRCYYNMSTGGPKPSDKDQKPGPFVTVSSEAVAVWMIENHFERWDTRAKFDMSHPEELKHKNPDGTFLAGLEGTPRQVHLPQWWKTTTRGTHPERQGSPVRIDRHDQKE